MSDAVRGSIEPMQSEMIPRHDAVERIDSVLSRVVGEDMTRNMSATRRAAAAWFGANGDRERSHTTRVFVKKARVQGLDPIICVYVDNHAFLTDLSANKDLYLARLANWGFSVSGIEFAVDREHGRARAQQKARDGRPEQRQVYKSELTAQQRAYALSLVKDTPEPLRQHVLRAIEASLQAKC